MKTVVFEKTTKDVDGLLVELQKKVGPVISVGSDRRRTYVFISDDAELDLDIPVKSWEDVPELRVESTNQTDSDGVAAAAADGEDTHTVVIQKVTGYGEIIEDRTKVVITVTPKVPISATKVRLRQGVGSVVVGPSDKAGDVLLSVQDSAHRMEEARVLIKFAEPAKAEDAAAATGTTSDTPPPSMWKKLRSILGF